MTERTEIRKIVAMILVSIMVCASVVIIIPNNTVVAEDSAKPFRALDNGFPLGYQTTLDQSCENAVDFYTVSSGIPWAQTFVPTISGELSFVDLQLYAAATITLSVRCEIRTTTGGVPDDIGGMITYEVDSQTLTTSPAWYQISFSTPAVLTAGETYALVLVWQTADFHWSSLGTYANGDGFGTADGGTTWSPNGGENFGFRTYMEKPDNRLSKVAWHGNNSYAYAVDGYSSKLYKFTRETGTWTASLEKEPGATFHDIVYDPNTLLFYIVGQDANGFAGGWLYNHDEGMTYALIDTNVNGTFYGVERAAPYEYPYLFLAVGEDTTNGKAYMSWYDDNSPWWAAEDTIPPEDATGDVIYDVAWNQMDGGTSEYYCVGQDASGYGVVYNIGGPLESGVDIGVSQAWGPISSLKAIDWHPTQDHAVMVGENTGSLGNAYTLNSVWDQPTIISDTTYIYNDVDWHPDGSLAMLVGENGGKGIVGLYYEGGTTVVDVGGGGLSDTSPFLGVAVKDYSSPSSGIAVGSSGAIGVYPSAIDAGTTITINTDEPHIFNIDMWKTSDGTQTSTLNKQVDVEETYTFYAEVNYTVGGVDKFFDGTNNMMFGITAWYDGGFTPSAQRTSTDWNRTRMFTIWMSEGVGGPGGVTGFVQYPSAGPGTDEFQLDSIGVVGIPATDHYGLYINTTFGPQSWAADGLGFANGASSDIYDTTQSFDDPNTWDFRMTLYDADFPSSQNQSYEEFGIFQFTNISVTGNPSGNAPPGSTGVQLGPDSSIICSANRDYYVNVSIPDLARVGGGLDLLATNIAVNTTSAFANNTNSMINGTAVFFPGANQNLSVWGNTSQAFGNWVVTAPLNSTTAHGPQGEDYQSLGATEIEWWIDVPGATAEGTYQATITFKIGYY